MQRDPNQWGGFSFDPYSNGNAPPIPAYNDPMASMRPHEFPAPLNQVEFQPSDTCPKNFVIFDQTYHKSRVMFHPSLAQKFGSSSYYEANAYGNAYGNGKGISRETYKEDTEEIDALLTSSEEGEEDDEVSTGRTPGYWENNDSSPDCSSSSSMPVNSGGKDKKKDRMKKMVRTLKGMIPGGDQMDTPAVLDEAVRYLKSLKVEVKKLGSRNSDK
ncbi:hypothetical protein LUZ60_004318 [Juncus effusus]|nr:hypothetical protein LUZ60_004318 [Juncus effusus]